MSIEENGYTNGENGEGASREDSTAEHSFDELARGVSTGTVPRRKALRMLAASLFGGVLVAAPAAVAVAAPKPGGTGCSVAGQTRNNKGKCVCPQGTTVCGTGSNARCVNNQCGSGSTFNQATCQCEAVNTCGAGEVLCGGNCLGECGGGQVRNATSCACECPGSEELCGTGSNARCVNPTGCSETSVFNPETCRCEAINPCGAGKVLCGGNCLDECGGGRVRNPVTCDCECQEGEVLCGPLNNQRCVNNQCGGDRTFNPATCECECTSNQVFCNGQCRAECSGGRVRDANCDCVCPTSTTICNNQCVSNTCSGGRVFNSATCRCECPATAPVLCGGNCVAECRGGSERCPNGCNCGRLSGGACSANDQCCSGTCRLGNAFPGNVRNTCT